MGRESNLYAAVDRHRHLERKREAETRLMSSGKRGCESEEREKADIWIKI